LTRRTFLAASAAGAVMAGHAAPAVASAAGRGAAKKPLVSDCHAHLDFRRSPDARGNDAMVLEAAGKLGIDKLCCSVLPKRPATVEGFQAANRVMRPLLETSATAAGLLLRQPGPST
jgi:uncharacterized protein